MCSSISTFPTFLLKPPINFCMTCFLMSFCTLSMTSTYWVYFILEVGVWTIKILSEEISMDWMLSCHRIWYNFMTCWSYIEFVEQCKADWTVCLSWTKWFGPTWHVSISLTMWWSLTTNVSQSSVKHCAEIKKIIDKQWKNMIDSFTRHFKHNILPSNLMTTEIKPVYSNECLYISDMEHKICIVHLSSSWKAKEWKKEKCGCSHWFLWVAGT